MKKIRLSILLAAFVVFLSNAQTNFQKLKGAIESAPAVVEGKIIRQSSFQDEKTGNIFTKNYLWPTTLFKGIADRDTVIFLTRGGRVGDIISTVSHTVQVSQNQGGIFLLHPSRAISNHFEISSYIERLTYDREYEAYFEGGHEKYPSWRFMREEVGRICGNDVTVERISSSELLLLDIPEFCVKLANPVLDAINKKVTFDVKAKSNIAGLEFARADIPLKYPQELLGSNIVQNGKVEAVKAESTNTSFYDLNIHDIVDDKFMLTLSSSCNGGESGFVLGTEFEKIAKVTVEVQEYGDLGTINAESFDVDGFAKYFLDGVCQEFVEKCVVGQVPLEGCEITSIETGPFAGGIGQYITFHGTNFGDGIKGEVIVPNADNAGLTGVLIEGIDYWNNQTFFSNWSDTEVTMNIASKIDGVSTGPFGSGSWTIDPDFTSQTTSLPCYVDVEIDYNLKVAQVVSSKKLKMVGLAKLPTESPEGNIEWYIQDGINSDQSLTNKGITFEKVFAVADKAFCDWESQTGVHFKYKGITSARGNKSDTKFVLYFTNLINPNYAMETTRTVSLTPCGDTQLYFATRLTDADIAIDTTPNWYIDTGSDISPGQTDFYSVLLHEIGHILELNHVMDIDPNTTVDDPSIMYFKTSKGMSKRTIDSKSIDAVELLRDRTIDAQLLGQCFYGYKFNTLPPSCPSTVKTIDYEVKSDIDIPSLVKAGDIINVDLLNIPVSPKIYFYLFNSYGILLNKNTIGKFDSYYLPSGVYYIKVVIGRESFVKQVIIID